MTHYALLRHHFDVHRNPDRLGRSTTTTGSAWR